MDIFQGSFNEGLRSLSLFQSVSIASAMEKSTSLENNQQTGEERKEKH